VQRPEASPFNDEYWGMLATFEFSKLADLVWEHIQRVDERITKDEPFKVIKTDPEAGKKSIVELVTELYQIGRLLNPIMPATNELIKKTILENKKPENLFPRLS
jgi:methionyl-tRNA synthetase